MADTVTSNTAGRIGQVARDMLNGNMHYLVGALELEQLRHEIGAYENDPDFIAFVAVKMEVESIVNGEELLTRLNLLNHAESELIETSVRWAKSVSLVNCQTLAERYT